MLDTGYFHRASSERIYLSFAMKRSGQHGVINWICRQLGGITHFNNCVLRRRGLSIGLEPGWGRYIVYNEDRVDDSGHQSLRAFRRGIGQAAPTPHAFYSFENFDFRKPVLPYLEPHAERFILLILRDPFNWTASRMQSGWVANPASYFGRRKLMRRGAMWKAHVRECLRLTRHLPDPVIGIDFGKWFSSSAYRMALCDVLKLPSTDLGLGEVPSFGGGSSFSDTKYDQRAQEMAVLDRWREYVDDPAFLDLVADPEMRSLSEQYFGFNPLAAAGGGR